MVELAKLAPAAAFYLLALAADVSGYTNPDVALGLAIVATVLLLLPLWSWLPFKRKRRRMGILFGVLTLLLLVGAGVTGFLAYRHFSDNSATCDDSVAGRLAYKDIVVYHDLDTASNPPKIEKVQLGVELHNRADVPIEYVGEEFGTTVEGKAPKKLDWENYAVLQPDEQRRFMDFPVDVGGLIPGKLSGTFTFVFAYGTVGNRGCRLPLKGTLEMYFDVNTGAYHSSRIIWDDKFRYGGQ